MKKNTLTCVYCGMAYPEGTPPHGSQILTDHIKVCEKHPMREAEAKIKKLRAALIGLVGEEKKAELEAMRSMTMSMLPLGHPERDRACNAITAILETEE